MEVSLRGITKKNYDAICELDVADTQQKLVACNMWSLVEANFNEGYETREIYLNEVPVGFFMWVQETPNKISIWRFMIDKRHQQKGIGAIALKTALD